MKAAGVRRWERGLEIHLYHIPGGHPGPWPLFAHQGGSTGVGGNLCQELSQYNLKWALVVGGRREAKERGRSPQISMYQQNLLTRLVLGNCKTSFPTPTCQMLKSLYRGFNWVKSRTQGS